jgi:hypothetical protein
MLRGPAGPRLSCDARGVRRFLFFLLPALACGVCASGCSTPLPPRAPVDGPPRALWDLAPEGASAGIVVHDGALGKAIDLFDSLRTKEAVEPVDMRKATGTAVAKRASRATWEAMGLDVGRGAAAFAWPQAERGVLVVLPVRDRAAFRKETKARAKVVNGREVDDLGTGYLCAPAAGRYLCALSLDEIEAAEAPHEATLPRLVARLPAEDRGEMESFGGTRNKEIAHLREKARPLGLLTSVATAVRFRDDGASMRVHIRGATETANAKGLAGGPAPASLSPVAAAASTLVRAHFDPLSLVAPDSKMDPRVRSEIVDQLAGDLEVTTSGTGVAAASAVAPLRDPERVLRYVKERCADAGGTVRSAALDRITVIERGCAARFDPTLLLLPVKMKPIPLTLTVEGKRLVFLLGDAHEPVPEDRAWDALVEGEEARRALTGNAALVAYTRRPIFGPEVAAGKAWKDLVPFIDERAQSSIDLWTDLGAHIYQAVLTAHVADDGIVFWGDLLTFHGDPRDARAAYEAALVKRAAGDEAGFRAALAEIEQRFPGSRAARRAADVRRGAPYVGAGAFLFGMLGSLFSGKK